NPNAGLGAALYTGPAAGGPAQNMDRFPRNLPPEILDMLMRQQQPAAAPASNSFMRYQQVEALRGFISGVKSYKESLLSKKDPVKDRQAKLLTKDMPLRLEAHVDDDLRNALKLADDLKVKLVLEGVSQPKTVASELKARRTPVVLGPILDIETLSVLNR